jgi:predicted esterase
MFNHPSLRNSLLLMLVLFLSLMLMASRMASTSAISTSCKTGPAALIFMHGLGDTPAGWSSLKHSLPSIKPRLKDVTYVFPPAPTIAITINGGQAMPGWFDVLDWPIGISARDDREGMLTAVAQIDAVVEKLQKDGIDKSRIVVGGFSQGGAIALLSAYRASKPFAGCVALSGWLTLKNDLNIAEETKTTPLFWGHGKYDDKVLFEQQAHGVDILKNKAVNVIAKVYPVGHSSDEQEMEDLAEFLDSVLFGDE